AQDHECRRALAEAFADVGARGFFAHGVKAVCPQRPLHGVKALVVSEPHPDPRWLAQRLGGNDLDRNAGGFRLALLLHTGRAHAAASETVGAAGPLAREAHAAAS